MSDGGDSILRSIRGAGRFRIFFLGDRLSGPIREIWADCCRKVRSLDWVIAERSELSNPVVLTGMISVREFTSRLTVPSNFTHRRGYFASECC
jgi:hypothetical protein